MIDHLWVGPCGDTNRRILLTSILTVFISSISSSVFADDTASSRSIALCPPNLTQQLNCSCSVLMDNQAVQLWCNNTQLDKIWSVLEGFSANIDKMDIIHCPGKSNSIERLLPLKIRSLSITRCSISQIHYNAFDAMAESLEELSLNQNGLTSIPQFDKLKRLHSLSFNFNSIRDLAESTFFGLRDLKQLRLKSNQICGLSQNVFSDQRTSLQLLDLSYNCFPNVPSAALRNCAELRWLDLAGNNIEGVLPMQFMSLPNLMELRLHSNGLKRIATNGFMNVPTLRHLFLQKNQLALLDPGTLQAFKQLQLIDLAHNFFYKIPSFKDMLELEEVRLQNNRIRTIDTLTFSSNPKLRRIILHSNQIETIARNSFDSLDGLEMLILTNNSLTVIEKGMFDGMKGLKDLYLRDNFIEELNRDAFTSLPELTFLDLSENQLRTLRAGIFVPLQRLSMLTLANNKIETVEKGAFDGKVDNVLLDGNSLRCDEQLDWFITWLVKNRVRIFMPNQPDIKCSSPESNRGKRLKDMMIERNNITEAIVDTFNSLNLAGGASDPTTAHNFLSLLPGIPRHAHGTQLGSQMLGSLAETFPEIRNFPGIKFLPPTIRSRLNEVIKNSNNNDIGTEPTLNLSGLVPPRVLQMMKLLPPNYNLSKLPPEMFKQIMRGEMPDLTKLPMDLQQWIKDNFDRLAISAENTNSNHNHIGTEPPLNLSGLVPPRVLQMMKLLPPNYNLSKLPPEMIKQVMRGEVPDLTKLPMDLQQWIKDNFDRLAISLENTPDLSIEDILKKLPTFEHPSMPTFAPYDINSIEADLVDKEKRRDDEREQFFRLIVASALGLAGAVTLGVLSAYCWYARRTRRKSMRVVEQTIGEGAGALPSVVRELSFRPSASSTLK